MNDQQKRNRARQLEVGTGVAAGTVGGALAATKLRDAFAEEHPNRMEAGEKRVARLVGARPAKFLARDKPGFKPLLAGTALAATATGASHYRQHHDRKLAARKLDDGHVAKLFRRRDEDRMLGRVSQVDATATKLKNRVLPPRTVIAVKLTNAAGQVKDDVRRDLGKAYDPRDGRRKRARAVQAASLSGAGAATGVAIASRQQSNMHFARSVGHENGAKLSTLLSRRAGANAKVKLSDLAKPKGYTPRTTAHLAEAVEHQQAQNRHYGNARHELTRAFSEGKEGHRLLRRANRSTLAAAGLGVVALGAREKARANRTS